MKSGSARFEYWIYLCIHLTNIPSKSILYYTTFHNRVAEPDQVIPKGGIRNPDPNNYEIYKIFISILKEKSIIKQRYPKYFEIFS